MSQACLIRGARLIDPASGRDETGDLLTVDGLIAEMGPRVKAGAAASVIEAEGLAVIPGLIDLRVTVGEPGAEHKETLKSAGRAALAGGVTTFVVSPETEPVIDDVSLVDFILRRAPARTKARVLVAAALTRGLLGQQMSELGLLVEAGAALFSNGDRPVADARALRRALAYSTAFDALVAHRPQDRDLALGGVMHEGAYAGRLGLPGIPAAAEVIGAERDLALAELTGARLLLDMVSAAGTLDALRRYKARGVKASASVSIHHLAMNELEVGQYRTFAKLAPPLRSEDDRQALIEGVRSGLIEVVVSGHDPRPAEDKRLPFEEAAFGAVGLETLLPGLLSLVHDGSLGLMEALAALTCRPAALLRLPQGRLAVGAPADLALVDLGAPFKLNAERLRSKSRNSPFDGRLLQGVVKRTIVGGETAFVAEG